MTSAEIWAMTQAANDRGQQPVNNFSALMTGRSLAQLARSQRLADIASERQYEQSAAEAGSQRRQKEYEQMELLRARKEASDQGISLPDNASFQDIAKAKMDLRKSVALNGFSNIQRQLDLAKQSQENAMEDAQRLAASPLMGNKEQRIAAARIMMEDPAAQKLPDKTKAEIYSILDKGQDPGQAINDAIRGLHTNAGTSGITPTILQSTQYMNAAALLKAYTDPLMAAAGETRKTQLQLAYSRIADNNRQVEALKKQAFDHMQQYGSIIPQAMQSDFYKVNGPPPNPADALTSLDRNSDPFLKTDSGPKVSPVDAPPAPMLPAPSLSDTVDESGLVGAAKRFAPSVMGSGAGAIGALVGPVSSAIGQTMFQPGVGSEMMDIGKSAANEATGLFPTSGLDAQGAKALLFGAGSPQAQGLQPQQLIPATPQEEAKAQAMVMFALKAKGMTDTQAQQFISDSKAKALAGDQQAILGHNQVLQMIRSASSPFGMQQQPAADNQ